MITKLKFLTVFVVLIILSAGTALAQSTVLIDAAKKEGGKVVAYGSLESDTVDAIKQAFQKNTGLELEYWRASATKVMDRALSEYRAGKPLFDVVLTNSAPMHILEKSGIFAKYDSPSAKEFPSAAIDPVLVALLLLFGWILWADGRRTIGHIVDQHHPNRSSVEIFALGDGVRECLG